MPGGNSHQRAVEKAAQNRMAEQVTETVIERIRDSDMVTTANPGIKRNLWNRLVDFIEHPLVLGALFLLSGIVGALIYTPMFIIFALCILLGFHRAGVVSALPLKAQIPIYLG